MKHYLSLLFLLLTFGAFAQPTVTEIFYPQYVQGVGTGNPPDDRKVPFACRMQLNGLTPNATYRYFSRFTDNPASTNSGIGAYIIANPSGNFTRVTSASVAQAGSYGEFTTNASGSITQWFICEPSSDTRFAPGTVLYWRILLNNGAGGAAVVTRVTATNSVTVLGWGAGSTQGTGLRSSAVASYAPKNFVMLWSNTAGTGRPVAGSFIESDGTANGSALNGDPFTPGYAPFYGDNVDGVNNTWGTIIPNNLPNGIGNISQYALSNGVLINSCTSPGGVYGGTNTANANGGLNALVMSCTPSVPVQVTVTGTVTNVLCNGLSTGSIAATASGGTGPYNYVLTFPNSSTANNSTGTFAGLAAGAYSVQATDANSVVGSAPFTVNQPALLVAASTAGNASCGGTATVVVSATGGTAPYTGTGSFQAPVGAYSYTVTDANGCTATTTGTIVPGPDNVNPTITAPPALSVNTNNGCTAIGINLGTPVTGDNCGVASVTNNAPAAFALGATTVTWTVTDINGNTATATQSVTVADNVKPAVYFQGTSLLPGVTGPSTTQTPYLLPRVPGAKFTSILSVNDQIGGYRMAGIPDGLGAFDNNNGTFTLLMNHELSGSLGITRAHGSIGAFVSKLIINKSTLTVQSASDLIQTVNLWNPGTSTFSTGTTAFSRFCSADLPAVSAFYNRTTGLGTQERIFMNGEESGTEARAFAHIATGANAGTSYELPYLGKFSWENSVASPASGNKTVVAGLEDATGGQIYFYIGTKTNTGSEIVKAGLHNGKLYGVKVNGLVNEVSGSFPAPGTAFSLFDLGTVQNKTGATIQTESVAAGISGFLRPEDGGWDPSNPNDFYFVTTNGFGNPSRLWRLRFTDITNPESGGTITAVLDGTEGQQMLDNITIDKTGHIIMQEDVGNNDHNGKIWQYTIATDALLQIAKHDPARFGDLVGGTVTAATAPFNRDEESSGVIDVSEILGPGMFLLDVQAHYAPATNTAEVVEGGQLLAFFNPGSLSTGTVNAAADTIKACTTTAVVLGTPFTSDNCSVASLTNNAPATFPAGNTTVTWTATDGSGNSSTANQIVVVSNFAITANNTAVTCNGGSSTVTVAATGGTAPYTGTGTFTQAGGTTVIYTVTDAAGCSVSVSKTISQPAVLIVSSTSGTLSCAGTTTITVSATGGTAPYSNTGLKTILKAGTYTYIVTDANGCSATATATVSAASGCPAVTEVFYPKFVQGVGNSDPADDRKVPYATRMTVTGLAANTTYRYYSRFVDDPLEGSNGNGSYIIANQTGDFARVTAPNLSQAGKYGQFTTNASGMATDWFIIEPTSSPDFQPGKQLYWRLFLNNGAGGGNIAFRVTAANPVTVLGFGTTPADGTGFRSSVIPAYTAKNFIMLYDNEAGTGRPVSGTFIESDGTVNGSALNGDPFTAGYAPFYGDNVDGVAKTWGTIIPNNLSSGIRNISQYTLATASFVNKCTSANGSFGGTNTANSNGGLNALVLTCTPFAASFIADPAVGQMNITNQADVSQSANSLLFTQNYKLKLPVYNLNQLNIVPNGTIKLTIDLGTKLILDPTFNLATAPLSNYFAWSSAVVGGKQIITGTQIADIPADFDNIATFTVKGSLSCTSTISSTLSIVNNLAVLVDEDLQNNAATLQYNFPVTISTTQVNVTCRGSANGILNVTSSAGTTVVIRNSSNAVVGSTNLAPGVYTVTATATGDAPLSVVCSNSVSVTIVEPLLLSTVVSTSTNNTCNGGNQASITLSTSGGTAPYTYVINGPTINTTGANTGVFTGLRAGNYTITVTDANGCTTTATATLTEPTGTAPDISLGADISGSLFANVGSTQTIVYNISEIAGNSSVGDTIRITKVAGFDINFNVATASVSVGGTTYILDNSRWKIDNSNPAFVSIILTDPLIPSAPGTLSCRQTVNVAVSLTRNTSNKTTFTLSARLRRSNGEINLANNLNSIVLTAD